MVFETCAKTDARALRSKARANVIDRSCTVEFLGAGHHSGTEPLQELFCFLCDLPNRLLKDFLIGFGRLMIAAHLANVLISIGTHVCRLNTTTSLSQDIIYAGML